MSENLLLIDCGNFNFYRFFATQICYCRDPKNKELLKEPETCWIDLPGFLKNYEKFYLNRLDQLRDMYDVLWDNVVLAIDCPRKEIWRNKIFPDYKGGRKSHRTENPNAGPYPIFKYTVETLHPKLIEKYGCKSILVDTAEADDVIAVIHRRIRSLELGQSHNDHENRKIIIISGDHDFLQLADPWTTVTDPRNGKEISENIKDPKYSLYHKILTGDKSDNIPNCFVGCGTKTADKCLRTPGMLKEKFENDPMILEKFKKNKNLIDFSEIPSEIKMKIEEQINSWI